MSKDFGGLLRVDGCEVAGFVEGLPHCWVLAVEVVEGNIAVAEGGWGKNVDI